MLKLTRWVKQSVLSPREMQVFRAIGEGCTTRQIAQRLGISGKTVETHNENIKRKLELRNGVQLTVEAVKWVHGLGQATATQPSENAEA